MGFVRGYFLVVTLIIGATSSVQGSPPSIYEDYGKAKEKADICRAEQNQIHQFSIGTAEWIAAQRVRDRCVDDWAVAWYEAKLGPNWKQILLDFGGAYPPSKAASGGAGTASPTGASTAATVVAARNKAAQEEAARLQAAHGGGGVAELVPLRPAAVLEAHNPANEASDCLEPIDSSRYEARGVSSTMGAVFRNRCAYPVETKWCIGDRCATGYDNLATMPGSGDRGISYDPPKNGGKGTIHWAGCRKGFVHRADFAGTLQYACK